MDRPSSTDPELAGFSEKLARNIQLLRERRHDEQRRAPWSERIAERITRFTGSMTFVLLHLLLYGGWIAINVGVVPGVAPFDPSFVMLAMEASVEAIFLSTFVLISQNRMAEAASRRADLDLHVNLLAEHELTRLTKLVVRIAERLDIHDGDTELAEVQKDVEPVRVLDALSEDAGA